MRHVKRYSLVAVAAALALAGAPARGAAQSGCEREIKMPNPGEWTEYESEIEGEHVMMKYSRLPESPDSTTAWIELSINKGKKPKDGVIYQVLVSEFPFQIEHIQEIIFKPGESKAQKAGPTMMRMMTSGLEKSGGLKIADLCDKVTLVGNERITVPGGTFSTRHYKNENDQFDTWVSAEAPFGLVQATGRRYDIKLYRSGKDAKPSITETPEEMP